MQPLDGRGLVPSNDSPSATGWGRTSRPRARPGAGGDRRGHPGQRMFELEHRVNRADGSVGWTFSRAVPILDAEGEIVEWLGTASDITGRKRAEEERSGSRRSPSGSGGSTRRPSRTRPTSSMCSTSTTGSSTRTRPSSRMWGRTRDEAIGKNCLELGYEPWHAEMHDREIDQVVATKRPIRGEVPFTGTNGRRIYDYIFVPVIGAGRGGRGGRRDDPRRDRAAGGRAGDPRAGRAAPRERPAEGRVPGDARPRAEEPARGGRQRRHRAQDVGRPGERDSPRTSSSGR